MGQELEPPTRNSSDRRTSHPAPRRSALQAMRATELSTVSPLPYLLGGYPPLPGYPAIINLTYFSGTHLMSRRLHAALHPRMEHDTPGEEKGAHYQQERWASCVRLANRQAVLLALSLCLLGLSFRGPRQR